MIRKQRITRVSRALTAHQRAVMVVRAAVGRGPEDPLIRETMPNAQVDDFDRCVVLANGVMHVLPYVFYFTKDVECATLRLSFLLAMRSTEADAILRTRVPEDFRNLWAALLACEKLVEEVVAEFGDPVVVPEVMSETIRCCREQLLALRGDAELFIGRALRAPAMDRDLLDSLRGGVRRDARIYL